MINNTKSGSGGRLYNRIRYMKQITKKSEPNAIASPAPRNADFEHSTDNLLWLKTAVVSDNNIKEITTKLELTRAHRDHMVLRDSIELMQEFPFFFTHPLLVGFIEFMYILSFDHFYGLSQYLKYFIRYHSDFS